MGQYDIRQFTKDKVMTAEAAAINAWDNERDRIEKKDQLDIENEQKDKQIANQSMSAEATKQNADTAEYSASTEFWQGELARARPTEKAAMMDAANLDFQERFPGQPTPYTQEMIGSESTYGTSYGEFIDVLTGKEPRTVDNLDKAITFFSQDATKNAPLLTQLRAQSEKIKKSDGNKSSLELMSGLVTQYMPQGSKIIETINKFKSQDLVTDSMINAVSGVLSKALTIQTDTMKAELANDKLTMEQYKDYADSLIKVGTDMLDTNPEAGKEYYTAGHAILQGLPLMRRASKGSLPPKKGLGFRTPEEVEESYGKEQTSYQDLFKGKMDKDTVVNVAGKNMSGTEFLAAEKRGEFSTDEVLGASVMDRNLPGGKVQAGKYLQDEKVYDSDGNEYIVSKFKKTKQKSSDINIPKHLQRKGIHMESGFGGKRIMSFSSAPSINLISVKNSKTGKEVKDITVEEFNRMFSLEKPGKTFKTYKEEKKILSPEEYSVLRAEAEKYAIENLGYTGTETSEELKEKMKKLYDIPKFAVLKQE